MTKVCFICEKSIVTGGNRKHRRGKSGGGGPWRFKSQRTLRTWKPNLRKITIEADGSVYTEMICMKCYKRIRKETPLEKAVAKKPTTKTVKAETKSVKESKPEVVKETKAAKPAKAKKKATK